MYRNLIKEKVGKVDITEASAQALLYEVLLKTLQKGLKYNAAKMLWGPLFTIEPQNVKKLWEALNTNEQLGVIGAGSLGKTFTITTNLFLDFHADPAYTTIKLISATEAAGSSNTWSQIVNLHKNSAIKLPGDPGSEYYGLDPTEKRFGFEKIMIPKGDKGIGRLRGRCHPFPRSGPPHPTFGTHSRVRVYLDEAEAISEAVWTETGNVLNSREVGSMRTQVIAASNTADMQTKFAALMEPPQGWEYERQHGEKKWQSKSNWPVIRLDGADCENVIEKRVIYPGFLTWEGYNQHIINGEPTAMYWIQARGIYPPQGLESSIIPLHLLNQAVGFFHFEGPTQTISAVDTALEGGDKCIHMFGRYGRAYAFQNMTGKIIKFEKVKEVIQFEQIIAYPKGDTLVMANRIMQACQSGGVHPRWLNLDRTGNGSGVHDVLLYLFSPLVMGTNYGEKATDTKVFTEDSQTCEQMYEGVVTELFYAMRRWLEHGLIAFTPSMAYQAMFDQLSQRNYRPVKSKLRVESKGDYKARNKPSPDEADAATLLVHLVRMNQHNLPEMVIGSNEMIRERTEMPLLDRGPKDKLQFIDFS